MHDPSLCYIGPSSSVLDALRVIESGGAQIALVVNEDRRLLGTLTDGDIRRALLHGVTLHTQVDRLMNQKFRFVYSGENPSEVLEMMNKEAIRQIPVLDQCGHVIQLLLLEELLSPPVLPNAVVIMAGGAGTRLRPLTEHCPKPMLTVGGKPILEILLEQCIKSGFRNFYLSVNYLREKIVEHFQDGSRWGVSITYLEEAEPLGTAGSLQLLPQGIEEPFLVLNGDVLTRVNPKQLISFHYEQKADATLCVREHITTVPFGVVQANGIELAGFQEKPSYRSLVNTGVYVLDPRLLSLLKPDVFTDMPSLLQDAQARGDFIAVCPIHEYWIDVGRPETLKEAQTTWDTSR